MKYLLLIFCLFICLNFISAQNTAKGKVIVEKFLAASIEGNHGGEDPMRRLTIYLPPGYDESKRRYPVIYFLHGWSQRYFGDGGHKYEEFDKGDQNKGDNIAKFVSTHDVIVVKSDGYNRSPDEKYYFRPYNVTPVETFRQFPI